MAEQRDLPPILDLDDELDRIERESEVDVSDETDRIRDSLDEYAERDVERRGGESIVDDVENAVLDVRERVSGEADRQAEAVLNRLRMYRESLGERSGMVFVFEDAAPRTFWMKNTYVPLDIVFLDANGTVINVEHARPQPNATESNLDRYRSDAPAQYVVELPRGTANETVVEPGASMVVLETRANATAG
ncbi:DUF192 domain-containing protein [Halobium palmae]|uniref:DUF192 domain-containing protein n=1 Tax=Halobium palmae TaxID=1776492 RepID=A0ABD5RYZ8_9EURY